MPRMDPRFSSRQPLGLFHAVIARDAVGVTRDAWPYFHKNPQGHDANGNMQFLIQFGDGESMLAVEEELTEMTWMSDPAASRPHAFYRWSPKVASVSSSPMLPFQVPPSVEGDDPGLEAVCLELLHQDPDGSRMAKVFRATFDQLYDGNRTMRYRWDQLFKTEKTHYGTLIEINLQREFEFDDGAILDYNIAGEEVDSKYSATGQWMLPPESLGHIILGSVASEQTSSWSVGLVRATAENRNVGANRDAKGTLNALGRSRIRWLFNDHPMQENILFHLPQEVLDRIWAAGRGGQPRILELLRLVQNRRISRTTIETVGNQKDPMARLRDNGHGARTVLRREGFLILGGDYNNQKKVAVALGTVVPEPGEVVSVRVTPASTRGPGTAEIADHLWRIAAPHEVVTATAPRIP